MSLILIKNAQIVNEGRIFIGDVLIKDDRIAEIAKDISVKSSETKVIDADGLYLVPGMIDDQVHFREPGLTHKANIASESRAAVAGGITSFIEMPNTVPQATTQELLEDKFKIAAKNSYANYSFMMGGTNDNLEELLKTNPKNDRNGYVTINGQTYFYSIKNSNFTYTALILTLLYGILQAGDAKASTLKIKNDDTAKVDSANSFVLPLSKVDVKFPSENTGIVLLCVVINGLNVEITNNIRLIAHKNDIKLVVVKNSLLKKAMEKSNKDFAPLFEVLKGGTSLMLSDVGNAPAKMIKEFRKKSDMPILKGAYVEESIYIGDNELDMLVSIKSKDELIGDLIALLQSPAKNVISGLQSGGNILAGVVKTLSERTA